jgi:magnesium transporter
MSQADTVATPLSALDPRTATDRLRKIDPRQAAELLAAMPVGRATSILAAMAPALRQRILDVAPPGTDWADAQRYAEGCVGRLLEDPPAVFLTGTRVEDAIEELREIVRRRLVVYMYVVDEAERLLGLVAFRELLYADRGLTLDDIMIRQPFTLHPGTPLVEAMREVVTKHFPVYPVCESDGMLVGQVRGQVLFEQQAFEISAQAGSMVGVEKEERIATPWRRSFVSRHPWMQINLLTVFAVGAVVALFEDSIDRLVVLAMFLPVLAGQSGNLGAQSLAVTLRGMTLGELRTLPLSRLAIKETWVGFLNGLITGVLAAFAMYFLAQRHDSGGDPLWLAAATLVAMAFSCAISGLLGALVPVALQRIGADPANASAILLTTATDIVSLGVFLGLATWWVL